MNLEKKDNTRLKPGLYIVATPIGNLEDITLRAIKILSQVDIIACEDTRHFGKLAKHHGITTRSLTSYHDHNEAEKSPKIINEIKLGKSVALVSDSGTPGISDPGYRLVRAAIDSNLDIIPLPGATAFVPALVASGLPLHSFLFLGFPPQKKGRRTFLGKLAQSEYTAILYESPNRIVKLLGELSESCGADRSICIARELSKIYEEFVRGTISECKDYFSKKEVVKGEFVVIVEGKTITRL